MENYEDIHLPWPDWKIGKYLGGGAYGKVYEIERNLSGIQEKAALKIVSRPKDESEIESYYDNGYDKASIVESYESEIQNYVQEYRVMKELQGQSNIVSCDDFTVVPHENGIGGDIFIRMELLTSLQQVLRERTLSEWEIIKLGKDISRALFLCESKSIVHRDIKPVNIMVSQFGDYKLGDFGVSKIMDHTTFATAMGTPEYQAPEVVHMEKYGQSADIYSLGITLYWLLNNRKMPFIGADAKLTPAVKTEAMEKRYRGEKLPAPKNGSKRLKEIVLKACEYDPEKRYASAKEMYKVLDALGETAESEVVETEKKESATIPSTHSIQEETAGETQTRGNSWSDAFETIGAPNGNVQKKEADDPEDFTATIGKTMAYQEQKEKAESEDGSLEMKEKSIKDNSTKRNCFVTYFNFACAVVFIILTVVDKNIQSSFLAIIAGVICISMVAIFVIRNWLLGGILGFFLSLAPLMLVIELSTKTSYFVSGNDGFSTVILLIGGVWALYGAYCCGSTAAYFKNKKK